MKKFIVAGFALISLAACGGRVAQPVALETALDAQLSCSHIRGELERNIFRLTELTGESGQKIANNVGLLIVNPIFLDLNNTQSVESEALIARNRRLSELAEARACQEISFEPEAEDED